MKNTKSRYLSVDLPEVLVYPALGRWLVLDDLPEGVHVKARLMRSQCAVGHLRRAGALLVLDISVRWWSSSDPDDPCFTVPLHSDQWLSPDQQVAS